MFNHFIVICHRNRFGCCWTDQYKARCRYMYNNEKALTTIDCIVLFVVMDMGNKWFEQSRFFLILSTCPLLYIRMYIKWAFCFLCVCITPVPKLNCWFTFHVPSLFILQRAMSHNYKNWIQENDIIYGKW